MSDRKPKILIVDDEVINLDILQNDLEDAGFEVIRAEDGKIALAKGIAIAKVTSFPDMEFRSGGSEVVCRAPINLQVKA
jgi:CheY-like chemotaxis protein